MIPEERIESALHDREELTTVFLRRRKGNIEHLFYCHHCQRPIFKYAGSVAMVLPGDGSEIMKAPFKHRCGGKMRSGESEKRCPITYIVEGFVDIIS